MNSFHAYLPARADRRAGRGGRCLSSLRPAGMREAMKAARARRQPPLQPLRPGGQPVRRTGNPVPQLRRRTAPAGAPLPARRRGGRALQAGARHLHAVGRHARPAPTCCSTKACTAGVTPTTSTSRATRICWSAWCRSSTSSGSRNCIATRRCAATRQEAVIDTILRRMPDYVNYICPQFSRTHVNFQRVPTVDTSNPFIARDIPTADESFVVIRFARSERHRLSVSADHAARLLHVAAQLHRRARRQDGARDATDFHADDPAAWSTGGE